MKQTTIQPKPLAPLAPEQTILITSGLNASDRTCDAVPASKVMDYLAGTWAPKGSTAFKRRDCYERTQPTEQDPKRTLNRLWLDLDGVMPIEMTESEFDAKVDSIKATLLATVGSNTAIKEACKWRAHDEKGNQFHKLSFHIHYTAVAGTKKAIRFEVEKRIFPKLKKALAEVISLETVLKSPKGGPAEGKLICDLSVYNDGNRKFRMLGQSKPGSDRPAKLLSGQPIDTLITFIPEGVKILEEPQSILKLAEVIETAAPQPQPETESIAPTETSDPTEDDKETRELLQEVIGNLGQHRWDYYPDWIRIGFVMFNEGMTLEDFTKASKVSKHFCSDSPAWIRNKWRNFRKGNLTQAILWKWLSEDDADCYAELMPRRRDFWALARNPSHAEVARFFYALKPDAYLYSEGLGWFQLQPNNIWKKYPKSPNGLLADIFHTFKKIIMEHKNLIDMTETSEEKAKAAEAKIKALLSFNAKIGNHSFNQGVIAFLPSCYEHEKLEDKMDEWTHLFAFNDGVFDLTEMRFRPTEPEDFICLNTGFQYPKKRYPEARKELVACIRSIFESDEDIEASPDSLGALTSYMLKSVAMALNGRKKHEKFFVWTGTGGNGKGLLADMLIRVFGDYYGVVPHTLLTKGQDKKDAPNPTLTKSKGKRLLMATEPEADDKLQVGELKLWTGGDKVTCRDLHTSTITYKPQFLLILQTNNIPQLNRPDGGIERRLEVNEFPHKFVANPTLPHHKKINIDLKDKIMKSEKWRDELWFLLLEAYTLLQSDGLTIPDSVTQKSKEYLDEQNPVKEWLDANYTTGLPKHDKRFWVESSALRKQFTDMTRNDIGADKFKASVCALLGEDAIRKVGHDFRATRWVSKRVGEDWVSGWEENVEAKAGKYWVGLKKSKAPMPPEALFAED